MKTKNCPKCRHFYITFHSATPYGCHLFRFESHLYPEWIVESNSGERCQGFAAKASAQTAGQQSYAGDQRDSGKEPSSSDFIVELSRDRPKEK